MSWESLKSFWAFDVDGVVADTRPAVREAYRLAGIDQPEEAWGISWKIWLPAIAGDHAEAVHQEKQRHYRDLLRDVDAEWAVRRPGADMAQSLIKAGHGVVFVTSASWESAQAVLQQLRFPRELLIGAELSPSERARLLVRVMDEHDDDFSHYVYVDDRKEGAEVARMAGWRFVHVSWTL